MVSIITKNGELSAETDWILIFIHHTRYLETMREPVLQTIFKETSLSPLSSKVIMSTEVYVTKRRSIQGNTQLVVRDDEGDDEYKQHTTGVIQSKPRGPLMSVGHRDEYKYESQGMYMFRCII